MASVSSKLLSAKVVGKFLENLRASAADDEPLPLLELSRELRGKSFKVAHLLLQNPLLELLSSGPPDITGTSRNFNSQAMSWSFLSIRTCYLPWLLLLFCVFRKKKKIETQKHRLLALPQTLFVSIQISKRSTFLTRATHHFRDPPNRGGEAAKWTFVFVRCTL